MGTQKRNATLRPAKSQLILSKTQPVPPAKSGPMHVP